MAYATHADGITRKLLAIDDFVEVMKRRLHEEEALGRTDWDAMTAPQLYLRLVEEVSEVASALLNGCPPEEMQVFLADAANFCAILADKLAHHPDQALCLQAGKVV